ncbi:uncharacterized protein LOC130794823 [Actinidia eriantha]|uniref:uncharacterized protein LOC130794823 n=1 Tax=Actinidia eriantha TaxID=165200 RepID=UPI00258448B3|nr:uncharacterized protein LOC130794823 [Actinidia eriantha]
MDCLMINAPPRYSFSGKNKDISSTQVDCLVLGHPAKREYSISPKVSTCLYNLFTLVSLPHLTLPHPTLPHNLTLPHPTLPHLQNLFTHVQFDELVWYDKQVTGKISYGSISDLSGIQTKKLFLWVSVTAIEVDSGSGMIEFYVGALSEKLPA